MIILVNQQYMDVQGNDSAESDSVVGLTPQSHAWRHMMMSVKKIETCLLLPLMSQKGMAQNSNQLDFWVHFASSQGAQVEFD